MVGSIPESPQNPPHVLSCLIGLHTLVELGDVLGKGYLMFPDAEGYRVQVSQRRWPFQ
jgi:hypothetical protein